MSLPPVPLNWLEPFTYGHLAEYGRACRAAALDDAANVCDEVARDCNPRVPPSFIAIDCAAAIRALKDD